MDAPAIENEPDSADVMRVEAMREEQAPDRFRR